MPSSSRISGPVDFSKPIDKKAVKGKTALVTGGSSGIGAGVSRALAEAGAAVTIVDLNAGAGEKYASELVKEGLRSVIMQASLKTCFSSASVSTLHKRTSQIGNPCWTPSETALGTHRTTPSTWSLLVPG